MNRYEKEIAHLLGYLTPEQVADACHYLGKEPVREIMRHYGWESAYNWSDDE